MNKNLIVFNAIIDKSKLCLNSKESKSVLIFLLRLQQWSSYYQFCDFSPHKSCKTYRGSMLPPDNRHWQQIYPSQYKEVKNVCRGVVQSLYFIAFLVWCFSNPQVLLWAILRSAQCLQRYRFVPELCLLIWSSGTPVLLVCTQ